MSEGLFGVLDPAGIAFAAGVLGSDVIYSKDAARDLRLLQRGNEPGDETPDEFSKEGDETDEETRDEFLKEGDKTFETDVDTLDKFPEEPSSHSDPASSLAEDLPFGDGLDDFVVAVDSSSTHNSMPANLGQNESAEAPDGEQTEEERNAMRFSELCAGLGESGSSEGLYQLTDKKALPCSAFIVPVNDKNIRDGDVVEAVLVYGSKKIYDLSAERPNIGFRRGFEGKVRLVGLPDAKDKLQVELPDLTFATKKRIMQCAIGKNGKLFRKGKPGFNSKKIPTNPNMEFPYWIMFRTKETHIEIPMPQQWRFQIMTSLDQIDDEEYLEWRKQQTEDHNTAEKARRAMMAKSNKSEKRPSSSLQQATKQRPKKRAKVRSGSGLDREVSSSGPSAQDRKFAKFDPLVDVQLIRGGWSDISSPPWMHYAENATQSDKDLIGQLNLHSKLCSSPRDPS